ncbi:hypothetical protein D3C86_1538360 [compost metagenome]
MVAHRLQLEAPQHQLVGIETHQQLREPVEKQFEAVRACDVEGERAGLARRAVAREHRAQGQRRLDEGLAQGPAPEADPDVRRMLDQLEAGLSGPHHGAPPARRDGG